MMSHICDNEQNIYQDSKLKVDFDLYSIWVENKEIDFSPIETRLLIVLVENSNKVLHLNQILRKVWGVEDIDKRYLVKWHIFNLRRKIEKDPSNPQLIKTKREFGYYYLRS